MTSQTRSKKEEDNRPFINDLSQELAIRPVNLIKRKRNKKHLKRDRNPVLLGRSPRFLFLVKPKKKTENKQEIKPINEIVLQLAKKKKKGFVKNFDINLTSIRDFLIDNAPKLMPLVSAVEEARDVLKEITGDEVNSAIYGILIKQLQTATEIKAATFVMKYLELNKEEQQEFLERLTMDKQNEKELSKLQKMGNLQRSEEGVYGLLLREIRALQRGNKEGST